jgi:uncharacterized protein (TIGR00255 family)
MTAYGRAEYREAATGFVAEIRSLNHRYRDVILRIPKSLQTLEETIKSQVSVRIGRGRVEVTVQVSGNDSEAAYELELNVPLVNSYLRIFDELSEKFGVDEKVRPDYLCQMRDVILVRPKEFDIDKARAALGVALERALDSFDEMRVEEGRAIEEDFLKRLDMIENYLSYIETRAPVVVKEYQRRLKEKIQTISEDLEIDENRMLQEVAIFADRCDITEEVVRARSHVKQIRGYMAADHPIGRRLDFLIQEINREVNTMSAKAFDSSISSKAVEIKAELEKLREQAQNVE